MTDYLVVLVEKFGVEYAPVVHCLCFMMALATRSQKSQGVSPYRETLRKAGVPTTKCDGKGIERERFGGHVCRVTVAVWL